MKNFRSAQQGFTIIELVVVILLLGILAATALPRFIDVGDEAREAVTRSTAAAVGTGAALYRAEWTAEGGAPGDSPDSFAIAANAEGYPEASSDGECQTVYETLLQSNAPELTSATFSSPNCEFDLAEGGTFTYDTTTSDVNVTTP